MTLSNVCLAQPASEPGYRLAHVIAQAAAARVRAGELQQRTKHALSEAHAIQQAIIDARLRRRSSAAGRELLQRSEHARLLAKLETMPVIEQAKGIIMAQAHCGSVQAFDLLRQVSQRSNVPVRELAAQIVANTTRAPGQPSGAGRQKA